MEFRLNVYNGKEVEKTYIANDFNLSTGTAEDILKLIDVDKLSFDINDEKALLEITKLIVKLSSSFESIMKEIFDGLTTDEYRRTNIAEVGKVVLNAITYTFGQLFSATSGKN